MQTKQCTGKCGLIKPIDEFYSKGAKCKICEQERKREANRLAGKIRYIDPETIAIKEKYKDDPVEMKKQLNNAKAKRSRERKKVVNKEGTNKKITEKVCNGPVCKGKKLSVDNFSKDVCSIDGYQSTCKDCKKFVNAQKYELFKDVDLENTTKRCKNIDCPCENPQPLLQFDKHVNYEFGRNDICKTCRQIERSKMNYPRKQFGTKYCSKCNEDLDVSMFYSDKCNTDGLQSVCISHQKEKINVSYSNYSCAITKIFNCCKQNANKRNIQFLIEKSDIDELYKKQNGKCAITGVKMTHDYTKKRENDDEHILNKENMSIDRINNSKGYTKNNIQLVCAIVNRIKHDMNSFELMFFALSVCYNNIKQHKISQELIKDEPIKLTLDMKKRIEQKWKYTMSNAKIRNLNVEITQENLNKLYIIQNGKCAITGQILTCNKSLCDISIDRIDSTKDYTLNNIQLVSDCANKRKSDISNEDLQQWLNLILKSKIFLSQLESL